MKPFLMITSILFLLIVVGVGIKNTLQENKEEYQVTLLDNEPNNPTQGLGLQKSSSKNTDKVEWVEFKEKMSCKIDSNKTIISLLSSKLKKKKLLFYPLNEELLHDIEIKNSGLSKMTQLKPNSQESWEDYKLKFEQKQLEFEKTYNRLNETADKG